MTSLQFFIHYFFFLAIIMSFLKYILSRKNKLKLAKITDQKPKFTILITTNKSLKDLEELLISIKNQSRKVPMKDVYVILEDQKDDQIEICKQYKVNTIKRKYFKRQSRGYALEEGIKYLKEKNKTYDAYFILESNNILEQDYLKEMEQDYQKGFHISMGYQKLKNKTKIISVSESLMVTMINQWINQRRVKHHKNLFLSPSGFYIHGSLIEKWKSYPFHSKNDEIELSYYACYHGLSMNYNQNAIYKVSEPETLKTSIQKRKQWLKNYNQIWLQNIHNLLEKLTKKPNNPGSLILMAIGSCPLICLLISIILGIIYLIISKHYLMLSFVLLELYIILVTLTYLIILKEGEKLHLPDQIQSLVIWYHPIFFLTYIYVFFLTLFENNKTY